MGKISASFRNLDFFIFKVDLYLVLDKYVSLCIYNDKRRLKSLDIHLGTFLVYLNARIDIRIRYSVIQSQIISTRILSHINRRKHILQMYSKYTHVYIDCKPS